jgi:MRG-binding protein
MHKHFRMIAISEHLRNHGINPEHETHTRIPGIWAKLREYFNLELIDERDNYEDDSAPPEKRYKEYVPRYYDFYDMMMARRLAEPSEAPSSPAELDIDDPMDGGNLSGGVKKRKIAEISAAGGSSVAGSVSKTRSSTVGDTEEDTPMDSSPVGKSARGARIRKRAAAKAKAESTEPEGDEESGEEEGEAEEEEGEEEDGDEQEEEEGEEDESEDKEEEEGEGEKEEEEESEAEAEAEDAEPPASSTAKSTRGSAVGKGRNRGRGTRAGRK